MSFGYNYEELIREINEDIAQKLITPTDSLKIVRKRKAIYDSYHPIIDYYYADNKIKVKYEVRTVQNVLQEMTYLNMLVK